MASKLFLARKVAAAQTAATTAATSAATTSATTSAVAAVRTAVVPTATTAAGTVALTTESTAIQLIDAGGSARDVTLPAEASSEGLWFLITNTSDGDETLTVKDDGASTIVAIGQNEAAFVSCDGTSWEHSGIQTIALS